MNTTKSISHGAVLAVPLVSSVAENENITGNLVVTGDVRADGTKTLYVYGLGQLYEEAALIGHRKSE